MPKIKCDGFEVTYEDNDAIKQAVFDRVIKYFTKHEAFNGESIMQCDNTQIDAPGVLADIADDIIKFETE